MKNKKRIFLLMATFIITLSFFSINALAKSKPVKIKSIQNISATVTQNAKYTLPKTVTATMTNGSKKSYSISWNVKSVNTSKVGTFNYYGTVKGYSKKVQLTLTVGKPYKSLYSKSIDIDGDKKNDSVQILGIEDSYGIIDEIKVVVSTATKKQYSIIQKDFDGYLSNVYIADFNGDKIKEIAVTSDWGGSSATESFYIYVLSQGKLCGNSITQDSFNFKVDFMDNYQIKVYSPETKKSDVISFSKKKDSYEESGVYRNGKLVNSSNLNGLSRGPYYICKDIDKDGSYEIIQSMTISGLSFGDTLGTVQRNLKYTNVKFKLIGTSATGI